MKAITEQQKTILVNHYISLAKEVAKEDPIDFKSLSLDEDATYATVATSIVEMLGNSNMQEFMSVALSSMIHLATENFVLNAKLRLLRNV